MRHLNWCVNRHTQKQTLCANWFASFWGAFVIYIYRSNFKFFYYNLFIFAYIFWGICRFYFVCFVRISFWPFIYVGSNTGSRDRLISIFKIMMRLHGDTAHQYYTQTPNDLGSFNWREKKHKRLNITVNFEVQLSVLKQNFFLAERKKKKTVLRLNELDTLRFSHEHFV